MQPRPKVDKKNMKTKQKIFARLHSRRPNPDDLCQHLWSCSLLFSLPCIHRGTIIMSPFSPTGTRVLGMLLPLVPTASWAFQLSHLYRDWTFCCKNQNEIIWVLRMPNAHYKFTEILLVEEYSAKALGLGSSSNSAISYDLEQVMYPLEPYPTHPKKGINAAL